MGQRRLLTLEARADVVKMRRDGLRLKAIRDALSSRGTHVSEAVIQYCIREDAPDVIKPRHGSVERNARRRAERQAAKGTNAVLADVSSSRGYDNHYTKTWTGENAPPVRPQPVVEGSTIRPLTEFERMTGRRERAGC